MSYKTKLLLTIFLLFIGSTSVALADNIVTGNPEIEIISENNEFDPGQKIQFQVHLVNRGEIVNSGPEEFEQRVKTARGTTLSIDDEDLPVEVETGTIPVGNVVEGLQGPYTFEITIPEGTNPGKYNLPITLEYRYTRLISYGQQIQPQYTDSRREETRNIELEISDTPQFQVTKTESNISIGEKGKITVFVENTGTETAYDSSLSLTSQSDELFFGTNSRNSEAYLGPWEKGQTRKATYTVTLTDDASERGYTLKGNVNYEDKDGIAQQSMPLTVGINAKKEQSFSISQLRGSLHVGDENELTGKITNTGPSKINEGVLIINSQSPNIDFGDNEYALPDLDVGSSSDFGFDVDVSDAAKSGFKQFEFRVQYTNIEDETTQSNLLKQRIDIGEERDEFILTPMNNTIESGSGSLFSLRVKNNANMTLRDISAKAFFNDPLSSGDDEAFISTLDPGETETITFGIAAAPSAIDKVYPVDIDFQYEKPDGDTRISDTYNIPISVVSGEGGGFPLPLIIILIVIVFGIFVWYKRRS